MVVAQVPTGSTFKVALLVFAASEAWMVTVPCVKVVALPAETVAIAGSDDVHCAVAVTSCVELSEKPAMAVNCCGVPAATDVEFGVTVIPVRVGVLTVALS